MLAAGMAVILAGDMLLRSLRSYFIDLASRRVDVELSARLMEQALGIRLEHRPASVGSFAVNMRSFETLRDFIASATITSLIDLPFALLFFVVIGWIAWPILVPVLTGIAILVGYALLMRPRLQRLTERSYQAGALRNATLIESLSGVETLKAMGAESVMQRKWEESTRFLAGIGVQQRITGASVTHAAQWCQQAISIFVIITGVYLIADGQMTMGGLIASTMLASRSVAPFGQLANLITQHHNARIALRSLNGLFDLPVEHRREGAFVSREHFAGDLEFKDVSFTYPGSETPSLRGVSFRIRAGERVAVLGRVGSGKSTLQKLAMGLYQPTEGAVLVDGTDLRQLEPREYRGAVGYVPQDVTLFHGTLRDNILLAHRGVSDEALLQAVQRAGLAEWVSRHARRAWPCWSASAAVRSPGVSASCVAVARALVLGPRLLILDEATSALDADSEQSLRRTLEGLKGRLTLLAISHNPAMIEAADRVYELQGGVAGERDSGALPQQRGDAGDGALEVL